MTEHAFDPPAAPAPPAPTGRHDTAHRQRRGAGHHGEGGPHKDHFLKLMFFEASRDVEGPHDDHPLRATGSFAPLRQGRARPGERFQLPAANTAAPVRLDSPATEVMTDLRRIGAATIGPRASIDEANRAMIVQGVRSLFVLEDSREVMGIVTSTDIQGERPMQLAQARAVRRGELTVRDIMTPADRFEVLDLRDVQQARVGDVVATLRVAERQHALVVEAGEGTSAGQHTVRGVFSLTQIARQLGIAPQPMHDIARTFAEIEAVIAS
jgi:hypothetical protein